MEGFPGEPLLKACMWFSLPPPHADCIIWGDWQVWPNQRLIPGTRQKAGNLKEDLLADLPFEGGNPGNVIHGLESSFRMPQPCVQIPKMRSVDIAQK